MTSSTRWARCPAVLGTTTLQFLKNCFEYRENISIALGASRVAEFKGVAATDAKVKIVPVIGVESCEEFSAFGLGVKSIRIHAGVFSTRSGIRYPISSRPGKDRYSHSRRAMILGSRNSH